ncbi:helix-turn-helix transcriptional regulator [Brevibacillus migulae]|uniref:helix-turn-helix transcriptional regulator n=1 Tax=Brevibacillus migulae TaxID=1644114 RepID=UPI00106DD447|nr:AraC family transcriptional regulator [Brevibacillus migulae]
MEIFHEKVSYDSPVLAMKVLHADNRCGYDGKWHYHKEIELLVILKGSFEILIEDQAYPLHDSHCLLIGSNELHRDRFKDWDQLEYIILQFDLAQYFDPSSMPYMKLFLECQTPLSQLNYIFHEHPGAKADIIQAVTEIDREMSDSALGFELAVSMLMKRILLTLIRYDTRGILRQPSNPHVLRFKPVLDYIDENLSSKIDASACSRLMNLSYYHFLKAFKQAMNMPFLEYVHFQRIKRAERLLLTEDWNIEEIAAHVGFTHTGHFYRTFKKYNHCSPKQFKQMKLA